MHKNWRNTDFWWQFLAKLEKSTPNYRKTVRKLECIAGGTSNCKAVVCNSESFNDRTTHCRRHIVQMSLNGTLIARSGITWDRWKLVPLQSLNRQQSCWADRFVLIFYWAQQQWRKSRSFRQMGLPSQGKELSNVWSLWEPSPDIQSKEHNLDIILVYMTVRMTKYSTMMSQSITVWPIHNLWCAIK